MIPARLSPFAAFAAVALLSAAPAQTQIPVLTAAGHGTYNSPSGPNVPTFTFALTEQPGGSVDGFMVWVGPNATFVVDLSSAMFLPGTDSLAAAGRIIGIIGNPVQPGAVVGATAFFAVNDNGKKGPDEFTGFSVVPPRSSFPPIIFQLFPQLGDLTTIQQIVLLGQILHIQPVFVPLLTGGIRILS